MFEYFEGNYTWNMTVNLALGTGGTIGDLDDVSIPLRPWARQNDNAAAEALFAAWYGLGCKAQTMALTDERRGRRLSAAARYRRAAGYHIQAERMQRPGFAPRAEAFAASLDCFGRFVALSGAACERCEVPLWR